MFRAISGKMNEITIAAPYFAMIQDGVNEEFLHTIEAIGPGCSRERAGYFSSSLGTHGLTLEMWKVGKRLGAFGTSSVTVEAS